MYDEFPIGVHQAAVWQGGDGQQYAFILETGYCDRVPHGASDQWLGLKNKVAVDPCPGADYLDCHSPYHLEHSDSLWVEREGFGKEPRSQKRGGRKTVCLKCDAIRRRMQGLASGMKALEKATVVNS